MGWLSVGGSSSSSESQSNQSQYGNRLPIISPQYAGLMNTYANSMGLNNLFNFPNGNFGAPGSSMGGGAPSGTSAGTPSTGPTSGADLRTRQNPSGQTGTTQAGQTAQGGFNPSALSPEQLTAVNANLTTQVRDSLGQRYAGQTDIGPGRVGGSYGPNGAYVYDPNSINVDITQQGWDLGTLQQQYPNLDLSEIQRIASRGPGPGSPTEDASMTGAYGLPGANLPQNVAMMWGYDNLVNGSVGPATQAANSQLGVIDTAYGNLFGNYNNFVNAPERQAQVHFAGPERAEFYMSDLAQAQNPAQATGQAPISALSVAAPSAASQVAPYASLYGSQVVDPALAAYDYGTDRAFSALDARTAAGAGFGNTRSGLGYSDLGAQRAIGRGQLAAGLNQQGLREALGFGAGDAARIQAGSVADASNSLNADITSKQLGQALNIWNAGALNDMTRFRVQESGANADRGNRNQEFNAQMRFGAGQSNADRANNMSQFNVGAGYQGDQQRMQALGAQVGILRDRSGISQQVLDNVVTQNGINVSAAQTLFMQGTITQSQLQDIVNAAAATNGSSFTQNTDTTARESGRRSSWEFSP